MFKNIHADIISQPTHWTTQTHVRKTYNFMLKKFHFLVICGLLELNLASNVWATLRMHTIIRFFSIFMFK